MSDTYHSPGKEELEQQFKVIAGDITKLTELMREIGEAKASEKRDAALAEATKLLDKSRSALEEGRLKMRQGTASVEHYIQEKPVQSAMIALGVGFLVGLMSRR